MQIKKLREKFTKALANEDPITVLDVLDVLYYGQFDLFEAWRLEALPLLKKCQEQNNDRIQTAAYPY